MFVSNYNRMDIADFLLLLRFGRVSVCVSECKCGDKLFFYIRYFLLHFSFAVFHLLQLLLLPDHYYCRYMHAS